MNWSDKKEIKRALELLEEANEIIESVRANEQEKYDNLPENLQDGKPGGKFIDNMDALNEADCDLAGVIEGLQSILDS